MRKRTSSWITVWSSKWQVSRLDRLRSVERSTLRKVPSLCWWRTRGFSIISPSSILVSVTSVVRSIFIVADGELIWSSVKRSSTLQIILSIIWISSLGRLRTVIPLSGPMAWSSFLLYSSVKVNFFRSSLIFDLLQLFVSFFLPAPTWGLSICAALITKSNSVLSSLLVWVRGFGSSVHSVNAIFVEVNSKISHLSAQSSQFSLSLFLILKNLRTIHKTYPSEFYGLKNSFKVAFGCSFRFFLSLRCKYLGLSHLRLESTYRRHLCQAWASRSAFCLARAIPFISLRQPLCTVFLLLWSNLLIFPSLRRQCSTSNW